MDAASSGQRVGGTGARATTGAPRQKPEWKAVVARYQDQDLRRALFQVATTLGPLALGLWLMYRSLALPYWATLLLAIPVGGLLMRTFIIMHDCAHSSFLPWRRANDALGFVTGVLTLTPFEQWRRDHALHHASSGDLDRRGHGDIETLTVREYLARTPKERLKYRLFRNPLVMFGLGPLHLAVGQRFRSRSKATKDKQVASVLWTNVALLAVFSFFSWRIGFGATMAIFLPAFWVAAASGIALFYVQHQFEDTYWEQHQEWDYATAAMAGSSYFKLPGILNWFTGNIGLHHVHHLGPRIPNYNLQRAHDENPMFHKVTTLTLRDAVTTVRLTLWDEDNKRLVGFREAHAMERRADPAAAPMSGELAA